MNPDALALGIIITAGIITNTSPMLLPVLPIIVLSPSTRSKEIHIVNEPRSLSMDPIHR